MNISFMNISILPCIFGHVLIAYQNNNLFGVEFGKNIDELYRNYVFSNTRYKAPLPVVSEFKKEDCYKTEDNSNLAQQVLLAVNNGKEIDSSISFILKCSLFRKQVLDAIRDIPVGKTATYKDIAINIGNPNAVRAVGTACGTNPIAVIIPCHRVIRSDGQMGGYKWGEEIKKQLLKREADILLK